MKKNKRRKKPPGAKRKNVPESNFSNDKKNLDVQKIPRRIRLSASNFDITEKQLKVLNELCRVVVNIEMKANPEVDFDEDLMRSGYVDRELLRGYMGDDW